MATVRLEEFEEFFNYLFYLEKMIKPETSTALKIRAEESIIRTMDVIDKRLNFEKEEK